MTGTLALTRVELKRVMRNRRYLIFTVAFPVVIYLLLAKNGSNKADGISFAAYYMISMATTIPSILIVFLLGRFYGNVHLHAWQWPAIAVTVWFGATIFAALAVAIGYRYQPDQVQPISIVLYFFFAILGGLWFPLTGFLQKAGELTPTYDVVKIGSDVIGNTAVPAGLAIGLVVWLGIFVALATVSVRATAETVLAPMRRQTRPAHRGPGRDAGRHGAYRHWYAPVASAGKRGSMDVQAGR